MRLVLSILTLFLVTSSVSGQEALVLGQSTERDLAPEDAQVYTVDLEAGEFVLGEAEQHTVDVVVELAGPDGETIRSFDVTARGPETFQFTTDDAGTYTLTVTPFEGAEGQYTMRLLRVKPEATTPAGIVRQQFAVLDRDDTPGAVVAVLERGEVAFSEAFGMASLTHGVPYTLDTPTNIGSTSKQFTAFALVLLGQRGELDLDDDVREYIPELRDFGQTVTLRNLLTHTSGYREFLNLIAMSGRDAGSLIRTDELIEIIQRQPELQADPGTEWNYNNTGYGLAALVVERVTGESFPDWMRDNVFEPLGMTSTVVRADPQTVIAGRAEGYVPREGGWGEAVDLYAAVGAGGIYTTASDLAKWMDNYRTGTLGGLDAVRQLSTPYVLASGDTTDYGLGLFTSEWRGLQLLDHGGADNAHRSTFWYFPEIESGLVIHTNSPVSPGSAETIAEAFFAEHLTSDPVAAEEADEGDFDPESFDPETFDAYAGRYALDPMPTFILTFRRDGDQYFTQATGQSELPIFPVGENRFELRAVEASVTFHVADDGSVERVTLFQGGQEVPGTRVADDSEDVDLADYAGRYFSEEIEAFYTLEVVDGELQMSHRRFEDPVTLTLSSGETFAGGFPIAKVEFTRDESGAVTGFAASNVRTRDVHFRRVGE